jgi:hypothetical protein
MPVPAKKRIGMKGYVSPQPRVPVVKRRKMVSDDLGVKRALKRLPAAKRVKADHNEDGTGAAH